MKRLALILATAVAGLLSLCAGLTTYGYFVFRDTPERAYHSQGPNAAWAEHKWVNAIQPVEEYGHLAATLRANRITDVYFYMGWPGADGSIPPSDYSAASYMMRELRAVQPTLRLHAWIGQVEKRGGGTLDLSDAEVRRGITRTAASFLALGFDGIHYGFPAVGSGNAHFLLLLDQTRILTKKAGAILSIDADALEPIPGLAWLTRKFGSQNGYWTRRYYSEVASRVGQIAVTPGETMLPAQWINAGFIAWQTRAIRPLTVGRATLFMGVPPRDTGDTRAQRLGLVASTVTGIRKGMAALGNDPFNDFGIALDVSATADGSVDHVMLENWLDAGDLVAR